MVDLNLKVPALEKLLDYAASGIGAVAGPMLASWKARKEAEAQLIGARAEADSLTLIADARSAARRSLVEPDSAVSEMLEIGPNGGITQRIAFQEQKRQANIAAVVQGAAAELGNKEVPDHEPDPDWTARFFDCVQDVSSDDMRKLWAKVLSGEVEDPGRTSLRTLDILKNMTSKNAEIFQDVCSYVIFDSVLDFDKSRKNYPKMSYDKLIILHETGLINAMPMLVKEFELGKAMSRLFVQYENFILEISTENNSAEIKIPNYPLTTAGMELYKFTQFAPCMNYLKSFSRFLRSNGCELRIAHIVERLPDEEFKHTAFTPIEPSP